MGESIDPLVDAQVLSALDSNSGYWWIGVDKWDRTEDSKNVFYEHYQFTWRSSALKTPCHVQVCHEHHTVHGRMKICIYIHPLGIIRLANTAPSNVLTTLLHCLLKEAALTLKLKTLIVYEQDQLFWICNPPVSTWNSKRHHWCYTRLQHYDVNYWTTFVNWFAKCLPMTCSELGLHPVHVDSKTVHGLHRKKLGHCNRYRIEAARRQTVQLKVFCLWSAFIRQCLQWLMKG